MQTLVKAAARQQTNKHFENIFRGCSVWTASFLLSIAKRHDIWHFDEYSLVIIYVTENSGSNSLVLHDSNYHQNKGIKTLNYKIARILPGEGMEGTDDMAGWFVCATLNKIYAEDDIGYNIEFVTENYSLWG